MTEALWAPRPLPDPGPDAAPVVRWQPAGPADLTRGRRELAAHLADGGRPAAGADAVERLLLAFEELASNAVRHGRPPVEVAVTALAHRAWLLSVSDAAGDVPPDPAVGRDPALGGLGLHVVAGVADAHGWARTADGRKTVWVRVDHDRPRAVPPVPPPRVPW
jgi:two-component sensor histidine kinase